MLCLIVMEARIKSQHSFRFFHFPLTKSIFCSFFPLFTHSLCSFVIKETGTKRRFWKRKSFVTARKILVRVLCLNELNTHYALFICFNSIKHNTLPSFLSLVKNCNHKGLGIYYLLSGFIFGISGTLISVLIRIELYSSGNRIISPENQNFYNISITLHGFLLIFFLVMPGLFGGFGIPWPTGNRMPGSWEGFVE